MTADEANDLIENLVPRLLPDRRHSASNAVVRIIRKGDKAVSIAVTGLELEQARYPEAIVTSRVEAALNALR